jgi:predicted alpha/beta hydrolase family esterase
MKVIIVHRWHGTPEDDWYPWLKSELEKKGISIAIPAMPNTDRPTIDSWVRELSKISVDEHTYFIGHSIGCQTIMRFLEKSKKVGGAIFVAGWFSLTNLDREEVPIAGPWLKVPIEFDQVKKATKNFVAIFSDDDPYVPFIENMKLFKKNLNAKTLVEENKGHFTEDDDVTEVPYVLDALLKIVK